MKSGPSGFRVHDVVWIPEHNAFGDVVAVDGPGRDRGPLIVRCRLGDVRPWPHDVHLLSRMDYCPACGEYSNLEVGAVRTYCIPRQSGERGEPSVAKYVESRSPAVCGPCSVALASVRRALAGSYGA